MSKLSPSSRNKLPISAKVITEVTAMTNQQIRESLLQLGETIGPITDSTKEIYKKKLIKLKSQLNNSKLQNPQNNSEAEISWVNIPLSSVPTSKIDVTTAGSDYHHNCYQQNDGLVIPKQMKGNPHVVASVTVMSSEAIRASLKQLGMDPGPIVATTRHVYVKKLIKIQTRAIQSAEVGEVEFSSDDEDMDWAST